MLKNATTFEYQGTTVTSAINRRTNPGEMKILKFITELSLNLYSEFDKQRDCEDKDPKVLLHFELQVWTIISFFSTLVKNEITTTFGVWLSDVG
jgi:hypothetical protein